MVMRNGELVQLSRTEWLLLQHLAANAGKVVLHTELLTKVWGPEYRDDLQYLRVWVSRVRRKLGASPGEPGRIKTFQGIGYLLDVDAPAADAAKGGRHSRRRARGPGGGRRRPGLGVGPVSTPAALTAVHPASYHPPQLKSTIKSGGGTGPWKPRQPTGGMPARCQFRAGPPAR